MADPPIGHAGSINGSMAPAGPNASHSSTAFSPNFEVHEGYFMGKENVVDEPSVLLFTSNGSCYGCVRLLRGVKILRS